MWVIIMCLFCFTNKSNITPVRMVFSMLAALLWMMLRHIQSDVAKQDKDFGHFPIVDPGGYLDARACGARYSRASLAPTWGRSIGV